MEKKQVPQPEKAVVVKDMVSTVTVELQEAPMTDEDFYWLMLEMNEAY